MMKARENPFNTGRIAELRFRISGDNWENLETRMRRLNYRCALVGKEGCGKSTLLRELSRSLSEKGFETLSFRLHRGEKRLVEMASLRRDAMPGVILMVDGAEQLSLAGWLEIKGAARRAAGLIITSHRPGLLPLLYRCSTSFELLEELVAELLSERNLSSVFGEHPTPDRTLLQELFRKHRGNLREVFFALYDRSAGIKR